MRILLVLTLLLLSPPLKALEQPWLILTEPFPPYFSPELPNNGWMHDLVATALTNQGINVTIEYVAWSRAMRLTASGGAVAALGAYKSVQREQRYYYSKAIGKTDTGFFGKSTLALTTPLQLDDLKKYVIAKGEEYVVVEGFEDHPDLSFTETVDLITSLHMLLGGRVDLVAGTKQVGEYWLHHHPKFTERPESSSINFIEPALATQKMYMIFGKVQDGNDIRVKQFNKAIADFVWSGELSTLLTRHLLPEAERQSIITLLQEQFEKPNY
ncbi:substrate-binding periplasmic protein [Colwelliaceae bacterium 6471]